MNVIVYDRVSTEEQGQSGLGQEAQRYAIEAYVTFKGWTVIGSESDVISSKKRRPGLERAIARCEAGEAQAIVAAKLSRLSRGMVETIELIERSHKRGWSLVALDADIDTTTPTGMLVAGIIAAINQYERSVTGERTKDALAAAKARGVKIGRPRRIPDEIRARVVELAEEYGFTGAARRLNEDGVPATGARWYPSTVRYVALHP